MSLKNKLARLKPHLAIEQEKKQAEPEPDLTEIPFREQWEKENTSPFFFDGQYCLVREVTYPLSYQHGLYQFHDFVEAVRIWNDATVQHPLSSFGHKPEDLFFFDTETTGLGGGVGNTIFLLGYASISKDSLILRQHILPHPGAEVPLYQSFLEKVNYKTLVTYNGKSFDWPQVKTRHMLVRDHVPKLPPFGHFDLYHAARRLWKHQLDRLKLSVVEKEVLGIERDNDIPGYLAPMIYFDFIESKQPDGMIGILKHNEIDILSLITLYTHLTYLLCEKDPAMTRKESYEVGRWYSYIGEQNKAENIFASLTEGSDQTSYQAKLALASHYKKAQQWDQALDLFQEVGNKEIVDLSVEACIEAAKILEHRKQNIPLAIEYCEKAMKIVNKMEANAPQRISQQLDKRFARLDKKRKRFPG